MISSCSCWWHYFWYIGLLDQLGMLLAMFSCLLANTSRFLYSTQFSSSSAQSFEWGCCDQSADLSPWSYWSSYNWPQPIDPAYSHPSVWPSYPLADENFLPAVCHQRQCANIFDQSGFVFTHYFHVCMFLYWMSAGIWRDLNYVLLFWLAQGLYYSQHRGYHRLFFLTSCG